MKKIIFLFLILSIACFGKFEEKFGVKVTVEEGAKLTAKSKQLGIQKSTFYEIKYPVESLEGYGLTVVETKNKQKAIEFYDLTLEFLLNMPEAEIIETHNFNRTAHTSLKAGEERIFIQRENNIVRIIGLGEGSKRKQKNKDFLNYMKLNKLISLTEVTSITINLELY